MSKMLNLVCVCVVLATTKYHVHAAELCQQEPTWKTTLCLYIGNCVSDGRRLFTLVRNKQAAVDGAEYNLRDPRNISSVEDFYLELFSYNNILRGLDSSMKTYMATPEYASESRVLEVAYFANNYTQRITRSILTMGQTIDYMSDTVGQTTQSVISTTTGVSTLNNMGEIYAETYYVTNKMTTLLQTWQQKCRSCPSTRRRRAIMGNYSDKTSYHED